MFYVSLILKIPPLPFFLSLGRWINSLNSLDFADGTLMVHPTCPPARGIVHKLEAGFTLLLGFNQSGSQIFFLLSPPPGRQGPSLQGADSAFLGHLPHFALLYFLTSLSHHLKHPPCFLYLQNDYSVFKTQFESQMSLTKSVTSSYVSEADYAAGSPSCAQSSLSQHLLHPSIFA